MGLFLVSHLDLFILLLCLGAALELLSKPLTIVKCGLVITLVVGGLLGADWVQPHLPSAPLSTSTQNPTHSASAGGEEGCEPEYDLCITFAELENEDHCEDSDDFCFTLVETEAGD